MSASPISLDQAPFHSSFADALRADPSRELRSRQVPGYHYSLTAPTPVRDPRLLAWAEELGAALGLSRPPERGPAVDVLAGNLVTPSMRPFAARYGGHQFGNWAGQLGDGRAIALGEITGPDGRNWEIQLKGAGPTPYSRRADGRAVLRSSIREFLCSEAMHYLGVPTTRALSLVATGEEVVRDMFYNGNTRPEPGAVVARVAPSFVRFGNFQILAAQGENEQLRELTDYVVTRFYPELGAPSPETYLRFFGEVSRRTAVMLAHWMTVGFVHGVMNTDNMSILGLTIDYGPYGWLEPYQPDWTPNTTDFATHRYAFGEQPRVGLWNLMMLAQALGPLLPDVQQLRPALDEYIATFTRTRNELLRRKLGLTSQPDHDDAPLLDGLLQALAAAEVDMTVFFRRLAHTAPALLAAPDEQTEALDALLTAAAYPESAPAGLGQLRQWLEQYLPRLRQEPAEAASIGQTMLAANPKYVLRNYLASQVIEAAEAGDLAPLNRLFEVLKRPFDEQPEHEELAAKRPAWAATKPGSATLSCSS